MSCFNSKVIVITGAGSGIGRCLAQQCAEKGVRLALSDVNAMACRNSRQPAKGAEPRPSPQRLSKRNDPRGRGCGTRSRLAVTTWHCLMN